VLIVHQLARVLLDVMRSIPIAWSRRGSCHRAKCRSPLADQRVVELADLIALRQVGVEVVLAVEARPLVDLGAHRHAGAHRLADALGVGHRQHPRHRRVDQS
jgi:hypothetical protein